MASHKPAWMSRVNLTPSKQPKDASSYKCQKCLQTGHFTYQCSNKRKHTSRVTRTQLLEKKIEDIKKSSKPPEHEHEHEPEVEPPAKKSRLTERAILKAEELSDLSSQSSESDSESTDSDSSDSSTTSTSSTSSSSSSDGTDKQIVVEVKSKNI